MYKFWKKWEKYENCVGTGVRVGGRNNFKYIWNHNKCEHNGRERVKRDGKKRYIGIY